MDYIYRVMHGTYMHDSVPLFSVPPFLLLCLSTPAGAQAADDTPPLRPILCLALCFAPAPSHLSSSMCFLVFLCLDNLEGSISRAFFVILLPAFLIVCPIQVHFLRVIVVFMESCSAMFHNSLLVILSVFPVDVEDSS